MNPTDVRKCLDQLSAAKSALFDGKVIRSERLTGELGEYLAMLQLGGHLATATSNKGWDLLAEIGGNKDQRVQVKAHAKGSRNTARWSQFTSIDAFDYLFIVVLSPNYCVRELYLVDRVALTNLAKLDTKRRIWTVSWDILRKANKTLKPVKTVVGCFGLPVPMTGRPPSVPPNVLDAQPDPCDDGLPPWELLTGPTADRLLFAPTVWRSWNVTPTNQAGVLKTHRYLVFEYRGPRMTAGNKITLRGLVPVAFPAAVHANLATAIINSQWALPGGQGHAIDTKGYAVWRADGALPPHHQALPYPNGGFATDQAVFDWLVKWDNLIGPFPPHLSRLWNFISAVRP